MNRFLIDRVTGRDNNLNLIRMVAAVCVMVSHTFPLALGVGTAEPLEHATGRSLGTFAVWVFFYISGFLVSQSYDRQRSVSRWIVARVSRLYPGLFVALVLTVLVLGPSVTALPLNEYLLSPATWTYFPGNLSLYFSQHRLPGVFESVPFTIVVNGSLWTLFYEVCCYGGVLIVGVIGFLHRQRYFNVVLVCFGALYIVGQMGWIKPLPLIGSRLEILLVLAFPFLLGMATYVYRDRLRLDWRVAAALWALGVAVFAFAAAIEVLLVALSYTVLVVAYLPRGKILAYNRLGDYSYGTYIYAFPVQQLVEFVGPTSDWRLNLALSLPITLAFAVLSWKFVEQPGLKIGKDVSAWLDARRDKGRRVSVC
ncbi:acyltransferase [Novosphingobium aquae]|uniref:Acyltransferase n=1 Tax=Novosphingobium aquae TaxID=3133435 RepID=A0ABU8SDW1_9SPHN